MFRECLMLSSLKKNIWKRLQMPLFHTCEKERSMPVFSNLPTLVWGPTEMEISLLPGSIIISLSRPGKSTEALVTSVSTLNPLLAEEWKIRHARFKYDPLLALLPSLLLAGIWKGPMSLEYLIIMCFKKRSLTAPRGHSRVPGCNIHVFSASN